MQFLKKILVLAVVGSVVFFSACTEEEPLNETTINITSPADSSVVAANDLATLAVSFAATVELFDVTVTLTDASGNELFEPWTAAGTGATSLDWEEGPLDLAAYAGSSLTITASACDDAECLTSTSATSSFSVE